MKKMPLKLVSGLLVMLLLGVIASPLATPVRAQEKCEHINLLVCFGEQVYADGQYSVEVTTMCKDCGELLDAQKVKSDIEMDIDVLSLDVGLQYNASAQQSDISRYSWCSHTDTIETYPEWTQSSCYRVRLVSITCRACGEFLRNVEQRMETGHTGTSGSWHDGGHTSANVHYYYQICTYDGERCNQLYASCSGTGGHVRPNSNELPLGKAA